MGRCRAQKALSSGNTFRRGDHLTPPAQGLPGLAHSSDPAGMELGDLRLEFLVAEFAGGRERDRAA
jgi:hypothetical protein